MSLSQNRSTQSQKQDLKNKLDLITDEILLLEDEIQKEKRKVLNAEKQIENTSSEANALDKLNKQKDDLQVLQAKVEERLEVAERLEADGEEYANELFAKNESKIDEEIESLKAEIAAKRKLLKPYSHE